MKRISDKKIERIENKKRKIQSFIDLIDIKSDNRIGSAEEPTDKDIDSSEDNNKNVFDSNFKQMSELRKKLSIKLSTERPKIFIETKYLITDITTEPIVECLSLEDIQHMILATLLPPPRLSNPPNWCKVIKPTKASKVTVFAFDFDLNESTFDENLFKYCVKFETTEDWIKHLINVRLSNRQLEKMHKEFKSKTTEPILEPIEISSDEKITRSQLLLSALQMSIEKYPLLTDPNYGDFAKTKTKYSPVSDTSSIYSVDCEMCYTTAEKLEVARISVVDEDCAVIFDTLVKPKNKIINYLTKFSGITKKLLDPIDVNLEYVHKELDRILPEDAILCGQSLNSDLQALQLIHPYIIDTSVIYNLSGFRPTKPSLKTLAQRFLNMSIQNDRSGHDSAEDAMAAMKLVKLKLSMGLEFGDRVLNKKAFVCDSFKQSMTITSYLERLNTQLSVYYDYVDIEGSDKSMFIYSKHNFDSFNAINRVIHTDRAVCIVLHKNGKCFIKF